LKIESGNQIRFRNDYLDANFYVTSALERWNIFVMSIAAV